MKETPQYPATPEMRTSSSSFTTSQNASTKSVNDHEKSGNLSAETSADKENNNKQVCQYAIIHQ